MPFSGFPSAGSSACTLLERVSRASNREAYVGRHGDHDGGRYDRSPRNDEKPLGRVPNRNAIRNDAKLGAKQEAIMQRPGSGERKAAYNAVGGEYRIALAQMSLVLFTAWWNAWFNILVPPIQRHPVIESDLKDPLPLPEPLAVARAGGGLLA
jgi:hypothetical protein